MIGRKIAVAVAGAALVASLGLFGCGGQTITGSVESVVEQCQELPTDAKVRIEVTGELMRGMNVSVGDTSVILSSHEGFSSMSVFASFDPLTDEQASDINMGRVTIVGDLDAGYVQDSSIFIRNCKVK